MESNPVIWADYPDPDIIRVDDTYYLASTTMHYTPGCAILRSYDLLHWELISHVYDELDGTPGQRLDNGNIYGQGMWAPSLRYHNGKYYVCFAANDTKQTYLYTAKDPYGPWEKHFIEGFYHDPSLLFDDDGRVFLANGNTDIHLVELAADLSGPKPNGLERVLITDQGDVVLGHEGAHLIKYQGKYYLFTINWPRTGTNRRTANCFVADSLTGEFQGGVLIDDDLGYFNNGVAQGGLIDTPNGDLYLFMFQDRGAVGRVPVILPVTMVDGFPTLTGAIPPSLAIPSTRPNHQYQPLNGDDDFRYGAGEKLKTFWEFNHHPHREYWSVTDREGAFRLRTDRICPNLTWAINTLTQRAMGPNSTATVTVDASGMRDGDYAGICALMGTYGAIAITKTNGQYYLVMLARASGYPVQMGNVSDLTPGNELARVSLASPIARLRVAGDFEDLADVVAFSYLVGNTWIPLGNPHKLTYQLDHFTGCRYGLFMYSTLEPGGIADFMDFTFQVGLPSNSNLVFK